MKRSIFAQTRGRKVQDGHLPSDRKGVCGTCADAFQEISESKKRRKKHESSSESGRRLKRWTISSGMECTKARLKAADASSVGSFPAIQLARKRPTPQALDHFQRHGMHEGSPESGRRLKRWLISRHSTNQLVCLCLSFCLSVCLCLCLCLCVCVCMSV